jgi:addiction module HigA family antidote
MPDNRKRRPTHPGKVLREDVLPELGLSQGEFAEALRVSRRRVNEVLLEKWPVMVDMAHRLARALSTSPELWLRLQQAVDIWEARREHGAEYRRIVPLAVMRPTS